MEEEVMYTTNAYLEDLFDVINNNTEYITLKQFRKKYGYATFCGIDGGADEPRIRVTIDGIDYDVVMRPAND